MTVPMDTCNTANVRNVLNEVGEKIFLDRYALKDVAKRTLQVDDTVIVCTDLKTRQREIGVARGLNNGHVEVELRDGSRVTVQREHVDKPLELNPAEMIQRVARGIAAIEKTADQREEWQQKFEWLMTDWKFVPGGRILAAAGSDQQLTFYNCYVIPSPKDSRHGIIETLEHMAEIMSRGGGVGINVSSLRPRHAYVKGVNGRSSGAVSWGGLYSFVTGLIEQGGSRRGALMLICNVWHPDVIEFIHSKKKMGQITNANISVGITDDFMEAVKQDADWDLIFPDTSDPDYDDQWDGNLEAWRCAGKPVITYKTVKARELWHQIIESAWASAEPGVFFVERYNKMSNSWYFAPILCTNPCGEQGLPAWGVCNLGAINLAKMVKNGQVDWDTLGKCVHYAVHFLDNVIDATPYFFEQNKNQQLGERRIGMGTMGLGEMLIRLGIRYGSDESVQFLDTLYEFIASEAYLTSVELAKEKGAFPKFEAEKFLQSGYMQHMSERVRQAVREHGIRNVTLLTQAPNGTTGTMVNTSTGIEPYYYWTYYRKSRLGLHEETVSVLKEWQEEHPGENLPDYFVTAMDLTPEDHVKVQAAIQRWVDSSISKTCNVPNSYTVEQTGKLYELMYNLGCKGGTIYRDGSRDEQVLNLKEDDKKKVSDVPEDATSSEPRRKLRPAPRMRRGVTMSKHTPAGTAHITMNDDDQGEPFEVFVEIGKGGSDLKAMSEALGRMISLALRIESGLTPIERVEEVVNQLKGIGGASSVGFGKNRVLSLPDAVAKALETRYHLTDGDHDAEETAVQTYLPLNGKKPPADICPSCGQTSLIREEGCCHCHSCGYSQC